MNTNYGKREFNLLAIIISLYILPNIFVFFSGFFGSININKWGHFSLKHFLKVFEDMKMISAIKDSILIALFSTIFSIVIVVTLLSIYKYQKKSTKNSIGLLYLPISFPDIVWALGFLILIKWGIVDAGFLIVILIHLTFNLALAYLILAPSISLIDHERIYAAQDLGSDFFSTFIHIILPEIIPSLIGCFSLCFIFSFDDFVLTFLTGGTEVETVPLYLYQKLKYGASEEIIGLATFSILLGFIFIVIAIKFTKREI